MNNFKYELEEADYEQLYGKAVTRGKARQAHRQGKQKVGHRAKKSRQEVLENITAENDLVVDFRPTYLLNFDPKHLEYGWILDSLGSFYRDKIVADVLQIVKAGKEANVYTCTGTPESGHELIAAKLYRPRMLRHLRNDAIYKETRSVRAESGKELRGPRVGRALKKKTGFGQEIDFSSWIGHEFLIQNQLFAAGADVPQPIAYRKNTILMAYIGDATRPGHTLIDTTLTTREAPALFRRVMDNVQLMLSMNYVHGDLSAYNILYWSGDIYLIDFPQVCDARSNPHAQMLLNRDVQRVADYFMPYGVKADPAGLAAALWDDYLNARL